MFENTALRMTLGAARVEAMGDWRKLHNEQLNDLYYSRNIICMMKSRGLRWTGHAACTGENRNAYRVWVGKPKERGHLEGLGIEESIILKTDVIETGWKGIGWITLAQYRDKR